MRATTRNTRYSTHTAHVGAHEKIFLHDARHRVRKRFHGRHARRHRRYLRDAKSGRGRADQNNLVLILGRPEFFRCKHRRTSRSEMHACRPHRCRKTYTCEVRDRSLCAACRYARLRRAWPECRRPAGSGISPPASETATEKSDRNSARSKVRCAWLHRHPAGRSDGPCPQPPRRVRESDTPD